MNKIFSERQKKLLDQLEDAVMIVPAHPELIRNHDVHFKFRQDSNFFYLTGFDEPDSIAIFRNVGGKKEYVLFVRPKDLSKEIWTGFRCGVDGAISQLGAHRAYSIDEFDGLMRELLKGAQKVYFSFFSTLHRSGVEYLDQKILRLLNEYRISLGRTGRGLLPVHDTNEILGEMRLFKTIEELEYLRKAASVSAKAHCEAMACCHAGLFEYQIEALLEYYFRNAGSERHGYPSIVATGANATVLHYVKNNARLNDGDLLLVDAGTEWNYYTADITRTFPVSGKMTEAQKELYSIVLDVQKECIKLAKPGATMAGIHAFAVENLTEAMLKLGFLSGSKAKLIEDLSYKKYYPHGTGHFLGMDVHDVGLYYSNENPRKLEPGMVFTIEPGFYVLESDSTVAQKYRGIGIRIEDDVAITTSGCEVLTSGVPKEISQMCEIIGTHQR